MYFTPVPGVPWFSGSSSGLWVPFTLLYAASIFSSPAGRGALRLNLELLVPLSGSCLYKSSRFFTGTWATWHHTPLLCTLFVSGPLQGNSYSGTSGSCCAQLHGFQDETFILKDPGSLFNLRLDKISDKSYKDSGI